MTANEQAIAVEITDVSTVLSPPATTVTYRVHNSGSDPVWLVEDPWFAWRQDGKILTISHKREKLPPSTVVFGYFNPEVRELPPGETATRTVRLEWPQRLDSLWNDEEYAAPQPGRYSLSIVVGYGRSPVPPAPHTAATVESNVLAWQEQARSDAVAFEVPEYEWPRDPGPAEASG